MGIIKEQFINVAGSSLCLKDTGIAFPDNYKPFLAESAGGNSVICCIGVGDVPAPSCPPFEKSSLDASEDLLIYKNADGSYSVSVFSRQVDREYRLYASPDWSEVTMCRGCADGVCPPSVIDKFLMVAFIYSSARYRTVLLHASCVRKDGWGVAFIGQSGAGKSTHSRLWLSAISGTSLLNDDQPAVRVEENGMVEVYGTPWSGKTPCYKAEKAGLKGIFRMVQASHNKVVLLSPVMLFRELLASCSMMKSDAVTFRMIVSTLGEIVAQVPGFVLENKPEQEAARLAYSHIGVSG